MIPTINAAPQHIYIDEKTGSDETGKGTAEAPFATALAAYQSLSPQPEYDPNPTSAGTFLVRKTGDDTAEEWVEMSASAKKRLVKSIDTWRKKELKAAQEGEKLAIARKEQEERDSKRREEAKGVVLINDESKGPAKKVSFVFTSFFTHS